MTEEMQRKVMAQRILHREQTYVESLKKLIDLLMPGKAGHPDVVKAQEIVTNHDANLEQIEKWLADNLPK